MRSSIVGAIAATVIVVAAGVALRQPLAKVPENTLKFIVGVMLTSFGAFWIGEGLGVAWPQKDASILYMGASLVVFTWVEVLRISRRLQTKSGRRPISAGGGGKMKAIKVMWGLLVDDGRLAALLLVSLIGSALVSVLGHHAQLAAYVIWAGLLVSLAVSIEYQLKQKMKK